MTINVEAIRKTAFLSIEEGDYVVRSPLCERVIGAGDSEEEAWRIFGEMLLDYIEMQQAGRIAKGRGRPAKNKARLDAYIAPDIKAALSGEAEALGISNGEMIEVLFAHYQARKA